MKTVVLIACCGKKLQGTFPAEKLYQSALFKKSLTYAKKLQPDVIYILSAKYGLVGLSQEVETYNVTLNNFSVSEKKAWAQNILQLLKKNTDVQHDKFIFLAGSNYRRYLLPLYSAL